jgi:Tfp pilus assembly protein PilF
MPFAWRSNVWMIVLLLGGCQSHHEIAKVSGLADSGRAMALENQGVKLLSEGKLAEAKQAFQEAIDVDRGCGPADNNQGQVYLKQQQMYQAAWEFEYAGKLMPTRPEPENNLALVYERTGKLELAITHYNKALALAPGNGEILGNLVRARIRHGDRDQSLKDQLGQLVLHETRPEWLAWAKEKLAVIGGLRADPSPHDPLPPPEPANILEPLNREHSP